MGQYIHAGICTRITINPEDLTRYRTPVTIDEIAEAIRARPMDLSLFEKQDEAERISWVLRDDVLDGDLEPFLRAQFTMTSRGLHAEQSALLDKLRSRRGRDQILRIIEEEGRYMLHVIRDREPARAGKWQHWIEIDYEQISYLAAGKALLECHEDLFHYLGRVIALQRAKHPIAAAVRWTIE